MRWLRITLVAATCAVLVAVAVAQQFPPGPDAQTPVTITRTGSGVWLADGTAAAPSLTFGSEPSTGFRWAASNDIRVVGSGTDRFRFLLGAGQSFSLDAASFLAWGSNGVLSADLFLGRDAANTLALKNSTTAQEFRVYGTTTGPVYGRFFMDATHAYLYNQNAGGNLYFGTANSANWFITNTGHLYTYSDAAYDIGGSMTTYRPRNLYLSADAMTGSAAITATAATGTTVGYNGALRTSMYKVTVASTAFTCAATTCDVTIGTLPAKTWIVHALADVTQTFACTGTCTSSTLSMTLGSSAGGTQYLVSFDADAATAQFGDAAAELGASLTEATIPTAIGALGSWSTTSPLSLRLTSGTGNIGDGAATNLSQGAVTFYVTTVRY